MGATGATANLHLPQFADNDKPSWRGDLNGAFNDIDSAHAALSGRVDQNTSDIVANSKPKTGYQSIGGVFHVEGYGADPTGAQDSTANVQAAIDAAAAYIANGTSPNLAGAVVLIPGAYKCNSGLVMKNRVSLMGRNSEVSRLIFTGANGLSNPRNGTAQAPAILYGVNVTDLSVECANGPAVDLAGDSNHGFNKPRFRNCRFWTLSTTSAVWKHRAGCQMISAVFDACVFENRASSGASRGTQPLFDVSVDFGNVYNSNRMQDCWFEARYLNAPAVTLTCTNGGAMYNNTFDNCVGEHCAGGFIHLYGAYDFTINECAEWDTDVSQVAAYSDSIFKFARYGSQQNYSSGVIRSSHRVWSPTAPPFAANKYDIEANDSAPTSTVRKGIRVENCDLSRSIPATMGMNGSVEVVGRTKPFLVLAAAASPYTINDYDPDVIVVNSASAFTLNLPSSNTALFGRRLTVKNIGAGVVTIPQSIDGGAATTLAQWAKTTVCTDGVNAATGRIWFTV